MKPLTIHGIAEGAASAMLWLLGIYGLNGLH